MYALKLRFFVPNVFIKCASTSKRTPKSVFVLHGIGRHLADEGSAKWTSRDVDRKVLLERKISTKFGDKFYVKCQNMNIHLRPIDYEASLAEVCIWGPFNANEPCSAQTDSSDLGLPQGLSCVIDHEGGVMSVVASEDRKGMTTLQILIPHRAVVDIEASSSDVTVDPIEALQVHCRLRGGNFVGNKLKCSSLSVANTEHGNVTLDGSFTGKLNVELKGTGSVSGNLMLCTDVSLLIDDGQIDVGTVYASSVKIASQSGDVRLGTIRSDCRIALQQGDLSVGCLDGQIFAQLANGNVTILLNDLDEESYSSVVCEEGDIQLAISSNRLCADLQVEGHHLNIPSIGFTGVTSDALDNIKIYQGSVLKSGFVPNCAISAVAKGGTVTVTVQDWFHTVTSYRK